MKRTIFDDPEAELEPAQLPSEILPGVSSLAITLNAVANGVATWSAFAQSAREREQVLDQLRNDLVADEIRAIGRSSGESGEQYLSPIRADFWIGAGIDPENDKAECPSISFDKIRILSDPVIDVAASKVLESPSATTNKPAKTGRPNTSEEIKSKIRLSLVEDEFLMMPDRTAQAAEIRARIKGESARHSHEMPGFKTKTIARWIGEVLKETSIQGPE